MKLERVDQASRLPAEWDKKSKNYFQKRKFLTFCEKYNPCKQRYYCLYNGNKMEAGCLVYELKVNFFSFFKGSLNLNMKVIGLPVSVSSSGIVGNKKALLINEIFKKETGIILIMNEANNLEIEAVKLKSLPTIVFDNNFKDFEDYENNLRRTYRRRLKKAREKIKDSIRVNDKFTKEHYKYYLEIMKRTKTKMEILSYDFFANLPKDFNLTTFKLNKEILAWHINLNDDKRLFFFFGGINYELNNRYDSYFNNLFEIIKEGIDKNYKEIDLGQTAELAKVRVGGKVVEKYIYIYHKNKMINSILRISKRFLEYKKDIPEYQVLKNENIVS